MRRARSLAPYLAWILASCGAAVPRPTAGTPAPPASTPVPRHTIEQFLDTTAFRGASFSPDGSKILVSSDESGIFNAYAVPVDGSDRVALTESTDDAIWAASYFPHDERLLYGSDQAGNELDHVYVRELDGTTRDLTPGERLKAHFLRWAKDEQSFFVTTNEREPRYFDVYEVTVEGYERTRIYQDDTGYQFQDVSPDKRTLVFEKPRTEHDSDLHLWDRETREMRHLTPHEGDVRNEGATFNPANGDLYYLTDEGSEFRYLVHHDMGSGERTKVLEADWDVVSVGFSEEGKYLAAAINNDARTEIRVYETEGLRPVRLPELPEAEITALTFSKDETKIAFYASASRMPRDLFVYELSGGEPRRLTRSLSEEIDAGHLVDAEVVRFESFDGVEVPGLLYRPRGATAENRAPAVLWVHGGPGGQSRVGYNALIQFLVNHGYAVYAINNRGSSGYGKTFFRLDDRKHGEADLDDCVASKRMLAETGWVDPERIGILGGSYGGYMVLAALTFRPDAFAVGVDIFGISNWVRTLENMPVWWESFREALYVEMGNPEEDREYLHRISPLFHAESIRRPLMVLQGANDPRVLKQESDDIVEAARSSGVPVEYLVFDDEGHGFAKKENRLRGYQEILEFLDEHLGGG